MGFLDDGFDFSSIADLFGGNAPDVSSGSPSFDFGGGAAAPSVSVPSPDLGQFDFDSGGAGIGGANPAFTPSGSPPGLASSGYSPNAPATVGGSAPGQAQAAPGSPVGEQADAPYHPANPQPGQPPPPSAWESVRNAPGKWWSGVSDSIGNEFDKAPIATTARVGAMAAPLIGAGIGALTAPKAPGKYTTNPPRPATAVQGSDTIPAASPMSTTLTGQGGFNVKGMGMSEGGVVQPPPQQPNPLPGALKDAQRRTNAGLAPKPGGYAEGGKVTSQDEADYQEAMRQMKGQSAQPQQPAPKPAKSPYDQQLEDADKGKQPKSGYFKRN